MFYEITNGDSVYILYTKHRYKLATVTSTTKRYIVIGSTRYSRKTGKEYGHMFRRISHLDSDSLSASLGKLPNSSIKRN